MILLIQLSYIIGILLNTGLAFLVLFHGRKEEINRTFFITTIFASSWLISLFLFYAVSFPIAVLWLGRFNFAIILPTLWYLLKFALIFPRRTLIIPSSFLKGVAVWLFIFTIFTLLTPLVSKNEIVTIQGRTTEYGIAYPLYIFHYIVFAIAILTIFIIKLKRSKEILDRKRIEYIVIGLALAFLFGFVTNILLYSTGAVQAAQYGPLAIIIFSGFVTTVILKHNLFNIKVLATQLFTIILVVFLFINIFFSQSRSYLILNGGLFLGSLIFGYLLIKSVMNEIKQREKLEELSRVKSEFMSIASHQLRTPLSVIKGYVSLLEENSFGNITDKQKEVLGKVFKTNEDMISMVNDLLNVTRAEEGKLQYSFEKADLREFIKIAVKALELTAKQKGLVLEYKLSDDPILVNVDKDKITQVISNLIDNAIKYTEKGNITVSIVSDKTNKTATVSVADTGLGIGEEEMKHLFESFTRGKAGAKSWKKGTGMGLYIARQFMQAHSGRVWPESEGEGKGSTFFVELPLT